MSATTVHFPIDFERLDSTRGFVRKVSALSACNIPSPMLLAFRIWMDFAVQKRRSRPLAAAAGPDFPREYDWSREPLLYGITGGEEPDVIIAAIEAGFLALERGENGAGGLILAGFWELNEHLDPNWKSIQSRGASAANAAKRRRKAEDDAREQISAWAMSDATAGTPLFTFVASATEEERQQCLALILRVQRACDRTQPAYDEPMMSIALSVVREYSEGEIDKVEGWLYDNRNDSRVRGVSLVDLLCDFRALHQRSLASLV